MQTFEAFPVDAVRPAIPFFTWTSGSWNAGAGGDWVVRANPTVTGEKSLSFLGQAGGLRGVNIVFNNEGGKELTFDYYAASLAEIAANEAVANGEQSAAWNNTSRYRGGVSILDNVGVGSSAQWNANAPEWPNAYITFFFEAGNPEFPVGSEGAGPAISSELIPAKKSMLWYILGNGKNEDNYFGNVNQWTQGAFDAEKPDQRPVVRVNTGVEDVEGKWYTFKITIDPTGKTVAAVVSLKGGADVFTLAPTAWAESTIRDGTVYSGEIRQLRNITFRRNLMGENNGPNINTLTYMDNIELK